MKFPEIRATKACLSYPASAELKYDGFAAYWDGSKLKTKLGIDYTHKTATSELPKIPLVCELYWNDGKAFYNERDSFSLMVHDDCSEDPYEVKRARLEQMFADIPSIKLVERTIVQSQEELDKVFGATVAAGWEGLVVKPHNSIVDKRWVKMKKQDTIELCVIGVGKEKHHVVLGLPDGTRICDSTLVGKGFLLQAMKADKIIREDKDNYYVTPRLVVEVAHYGLTRKDAKLIVRSPRVQRIRTDKAIEEVRA